MLVVSQKIQTYFENQKQQHPVTIKTLSKRIGIKHKTLRYFLHRRGSIPDVHKVKKRFVNNKVPVFVYKKPT
jgi:hypothetical protein